ncbi:dihydropteroate synthase [Flavobacterium sp. ASW18X]|uniref:dihydropteroate synthase n=1 Tax=Flavobacterium sp. ASW18X TaxID=2572595 RepID=UPI0010AEB4C3|nr:dihydropteroate synthase [Flavobacterium sp. ASW18X]TKD62307.1 dihydropteroate synthase [Flavobacterium sp. ASW18X]
MTINCKGNLIDLTTPKVMGILNLTPDSFFDGGRYNAMENALEQTEKMLQDGATFIDVGAYSSRPDAKDVSETLELQRLIPVVEQLMTHFPKIILSIDTFRAKVAAAALDAGAALINDISAGQLDDNMLPTIADYQVPYIAMHMRGTPQTMKTLTHYNALTKEVVIYFSEVLQKAQALSIKDVILDPGFGFAKTREQNFELLAQLHRLSALKRPILAGISRKSMIYKTLDTSPEAALNGTTALHMRCLAQGAKILRVHDVKEAMECVKLHTEVENYL